mgnify:CR=1 FL=1
MAICNTENILRLIALEWSLDVTGENNVYVAMLDKGVDELFGYGTTPAEAISNLDGMVAATFPKPQSVTMTVSGGTGSNSAKKPATLIRPAGTPTIRLCRSISRSTRAAISR